MKFIFGDGMNNPDLEKMASAQQPGGKQARDNSVPYPDFQEMAAGRNLVQGEQQSQPSSLTELADFSKTALGSQSRLAKEDAPSNTRLKEAKDRAHALKARLQRVLDSAEHHPEVKAHLENAIDSCDNCIMAADGEPHAHLVAEGHLKAADVHIGHAHKQHDTRKHRHVSLTGKHSDEPELHSVVHHDLALSK